MPPPGNARDARLRAFGHMDAKPKAQIPKAQTGPAVSTASSGLHHYNLFCICWGSLFPLSSLKSIHIYYVPGGIAEDEDLLKIAIDLSTGAPDAEAAPVCDPSADIGSGDEEDMVPVTVDNSILSQLVDMGFCDVSSGHHISSFDVVQFYSMCLCLGKV